MTPHNAAALLLLAGLLVGCNNSKPTEQGPTPTPAPQPTPNPNPNPTPPLQPTADLHTLDPANHTIPTTPVAGRLNDKAFTPDRVELEGHKLTLRAGGDFFADQEIVVSLDQHAKLGDGLKLVVKPSQKWSDDIPSLQVSSAKSKGGLPDVKFVNEGYALTLELGKPESGKIPGKIYLCLPDAAKSHLVGTFVAQRKRALSEPPGAEDVPYIEGTVTPVLKKDQSLKIGIVGLAGGKILSNGAGMKPFDTGGGAVRSNIQPPATLRYEKFTPKFDFTNLPPGRYLIYALVEHGPAAWKWVEVVEKATVQQELKLDESILGSVTVKSEGKGHVRLVPLNLGIPEPSEQFLSQLSFSLGFDAELKDGMAMFTHVPAGKYQVREGQRRADVEVAPGKTATVELQAEKK